MSSSSSWMDNFVKEQVKLMNNVPTPVKVDKKIVHPEAAAVVTEPSLDDMYNHILEKKPAKKKVSEFLQKLIDNIMENDE